MKVQIFYQGKWWYTGYSLKKKVYKLYDETRFCCGHIHIDQVKDVRVV